MIDLILPELLLYIISEQSKFSILLVRGIVFEATATRRHMWAITSRELSS